MWPCGAANWPADGAERRDGEGRPVRSEFDLIKRYLTGLGSARDDVICGVGDDAAIVTPSADATLLLALDTLVDGVHFPTDCPAESVGYRALAVNLSDIAAMGGRPCWALVGLTLPAVDEAWVAGFARGLDWLARAHDVAVVGGDVTRGPLTISVQITGSCAAPPLRRDGARVGDELWVSGRPGEASAGLEAWQAGERSSSRWQGLRNAFLAPQPRVLLGQALCGVASAAIDVSDGLLADAGHIGSASGVALHITGSRLQPSARLQAWAGPAQAQTAYLAGGDDYELCFTAPPAARRQVMAAARAARTPVRCIGAVRAGEGLYLDGQALAANKFAGYEHFGS